MAVRQINTADYDYSMFLETLNKTYKGKNDITISAYDTTAALDVKVGSVFEDNGAIFIVETSDITPTGYAGITNSTTFYLYYDESGEVFIYSNTVPVWNDALQGWYTGNDRAFFSMFKDSGGTLYQTKNRLEGASRLLSKVIPIGDWDMDADNFVTVAHGLDFTKIRSVDVIIRKDNDSGYLPLAFLGNITTGVMDGGWVLVDAVSGVTLNRRIGGNFDGGNFNSTSFNRGWITIWYVG